MFLWRSLDPKNLMIALAAIHEAGEAKAEERAGKETARPEPSTPDDTPMPAAPINMTRK